MFRKFGKKRVVAALSVVGALALAVGAYAYFTSTGSGSGTASVATSGAVTITSTTSGSLYPLTSAPASGNTNVTVTNNNGANEYVNTVSLDTSQGTNGISVDSTHALAGCQPSWFEFDGSPISIGQNVAGGGGKYTTSGDPGTLWLKDNGADQSACEGATVTVYFASN
jgi:hypothetical protein